MNYMTADQTLDVIEKVMIDSGIRDFCTKECKGKCCMDCYTKNKEACHLCEGRRLPCSIYLCTNIKLNMDERTSETYWYINKKIIDEYTKFCSKNYYFHKPHSSYKKDAKYPIEIKQLAEKITAGLKEAVIKAAPKILKINKITHN